MSIVSKHCLTRLFYNTQWNTQSRNQVASSRLWCLPRKIKVFAFVHGMMQTIDEGTGIRVFRTEPHSVSSDNFLC